ncbi:hypothetical protein [Pseudoteredinibacter isoporae]|uniref:hypothetical protein n=1 Tax=Pseudoteredinibacter isoporae TaxID=570281 RepID=UPI00310BC2E7
MELCYMFFLDAQKLLARSEPNLIQKTDSLLTRILPRLHADSKIDGRKEMWISMSLDLKKLYLRDAVMRWPNEFKKENLQAYCDRYESLPYDSLNKLFQLIYEQTKEAFEACCVPFAVEQIKSGFIAGEEDKRGAA